MWGIAQHYRPWLWFALPNKWASGIDGWKWGIDAYHVPVTAVTHLHQGHKLNKHEQTTMNQVGEWTLFRYPPARRHGNGESPMHCLCMELSGWELEISQQSICNYWRVIMISGFNGSLLTWFFHIFSSSMTYEVTPSLDKLSITIVMFVSFPIAHLS